MIVQNYVIAFILYLRLKSFEYVLKRLDREGKE